MTEKHIVDKEKKELDLRTMLILKNMKPEGWYDSIYINKKSGSKSDK